MSFVNYRVLPRCAQRLIVFPIELRIGYHGSGDVWRGIEIVPGAMRAQKIMSEDGFVPGDLSLNAARIRIQEKFRWIASDSGRRRPGAVNAKTVLLSRVQIGTVAVPAKCGHSGKVMPDFPPFIIEKTKFDFFGDARKDREIDALPIVSRAKWIRIADPKLHALPRCRSTALQRNLVTFLSEARISPELDGERGVHASEFTALFRTPSPGRTGLRVILKRGVTPVRGERSGFRKRSRFTYREYAAAHPFPI